jgi:hypothetical protein
VQQTGQCRREGKGVGREDVILEKRKKQKIIEKMIRLTAFGE